MELNADSRRMEQDGVHIHALCHLLRGCFVARIILRPEYCFSSWHAIQWVSQKARKIDYSKPSKSLW